MMATPNRVHVWETWIDWVDKMALMLRQEIVRCVAINFWQWKPMGLLWCGVVIWWANMGLVSAQLTENPCRSLFRRGAFARAVTCYDQLYQKVERQVLSKDVQYLLQDRYLLHAAIASLRESRREQRVEKRAYWIEQAIERLQVSTEKGYCKASNRCLRHLRWMESWRNEIQYARLTVVTGHEQARIVVQGFQYRIRGQGNLSRIVRPGGYELQLYIPGKSARKESIVLRKSHHLVVNVTPIKLQIVEKQIVLAQKVPPLVISGYSVGGVLGVAGAILLVYGVVQQLNLNAGRRDPEVHRSQSEPDYLQGMEVGRVLAISGSIAAGTGVVLLVGSGIAHRMSRSSRREVPRMDLSSRLGTFGWGTSVSSELTALSR